MSAAIIDTSAYSAMQRGSQGIRDVLRKSDMIVVCPITLGELQAGYASGNREQQNRDELDHFLSKSSVLLIDIDEDTADRYALIMKTLKENGTPVPTNDVWLAALAWQYGYKILTLDDHFKRIPQVALVPLK
ncbi:MAG: type II toxin-antitoxin system VapC family toxin [Actinomycetota bacterium]